MNIKETIRRILSEETQIPSVIRRRISSDDIEEAFDYALERMGGSMNNPNSIIYKEKGTTLGTFAKFVIDEMVTYIEQDYFNDNNRIYFSDTEEDEETYHEKIRKPLLRHYGKRIKERYNEVKSDNIKETIIRILREDEYSPAGKEIMPNKIVIHKSNPIWRESILKTGLQASAGECYKTYAGYGEKCVPAIFATNSTNKRSWFDSTYDDDVWEINTEIIPDVKWYKDRHFESTKKHIVTFNDIPSEAIELIHEGTGRDMIRESKFFRRRIDLDEVKWLLSINTEQVFHETSNFGQFKYELTLRAVESIMWNEYNIGWEDLPEQEEIDFVTEVADMFEDIIIDLYKHIRGKYNRFEWKT